jgi:HSP20 family protein
LTISHQKKEEESVEKRNYTRKEHHFQSFKRSFTLPKNTIEADAIHAIYESGVLNITLPKKEAVKPQPAKVIEIK